MSIFTALQNDGLLTAAKLQRLWAHCVISDLIQNVGGWPGSTVEYRLRRYGAGAVGQTRDPRDLTSTEASTERLKRSLDVALWVHFQLCQFGPMRFWIAHEYYVADRSAEEIAEGLQVEPKMVFEHKLSTARELNRRVKFAAREAGCLEVA